MLFPIFLMVMWRFGKRWILGSFMLLATVSLMMSQWGAYNHPTANFFLLPTRAWELAIGASIAFYFLYKKQTIYDLLSHKLVGETLSFIGLLMLGYSVLAFNEATPFPSLYALVPTVGTGLVILFSSKETIVGKILSTKLPVGIGLISYSAYLWHQPLFAFARHRILTEPSELHYLALSLLAFLLAYLSWRYVEKPFRTKGLLNGSTIVKFGIAGSIIFGSIGLTGHITSGFNGYEFKNQLTQEAIETKWKINHGLSKACEGSFTLSTECRTSNEPEILIWGDSYAMHLVQGILASNPDAKIIQITKSSCGPFFDIAPVISKYPVKWSEGCLEFTGEVRKWIKENNTLKYVVVSSPFYQYLLNENALLYRSGKIEKVNTDTVISELKKTLGELETMGVTPVIFSPPPANGIDLGRCLAKAEWNGLSLENCDFNISQISKERTKAFGLLEAIHQKYKVIRLDDFICENGHCKTHFDTTWIFRDKGHLSHAGSAELGKRHNFYRKITESNHDI